MSRILITGSEGFIGTHLKKTLEKENEIFCFDIKKSIFQNVNDSNAVVEFVSSCNPEIIVHLAANPDVGQSVKYPAEDLIANTAGTINVLETCRKITPKLFVFASTAQIYGEPKQERMDENHQLNPKSPYAISKLAAENYCRHYNEKYGIPTLIFRFFNIYGTNQPTNVVVPNLIRKIKQAKGKLEMFGSKEDSRDFIYVEDICNAIKLGIEKKPSNEILNLASGQETKIIDLAEKIAEKLGKKIEFSYTDNKEEAKVLRMCGSGEKARKILGWKPKISLDEGVGRVIESLK